MSAAKSGTERRVSALESRGPAGVVLFSWHIPSGSRVWTEIDGARHKQEGAEPREQFQQRMAALARKGGHQFLWVSDVDERL